MAERDEENLIRRFLLGELPPDELERVGERLLADEDFFARVDAVEEELIDDFARGRLVAADRERFERHFLITDERRERLSFARDLHRVLARSDTPVAQEAAVKVEDDSPGVWAWLRRRRALAYGMAFSLLVISSVVLWQILARRNWREQATSPPEQRNPALQNENVRAAVNGNREKDVPVNQSPGETAQPPVAANTQTNGAPHLAENRGGNRRPATPSFAVILEPGSLRSEEGGLKKFSVAKGAKTVLLKLRFDDDEESGALRGITYEVELQNGEIKTIHQAGGLRAIAARAGGRSVAASVPARLLEAGNYRVVLRRRGPDGKLEGVASYYFTVTGARPHQGGN